ncbi:MAG: hypothetical protein WBD75_01805 [Phycisphaerae bacterium]
MGILEEGLAGRGRFSSCASSVQVEDALLAGAGLGPYMTIQVETDAPKWLPLTVLERMNELLELQPNWDSYGARCLKEHAVETALEIRGVEADAPQWLAPTVERMNELLELQPNWDSYGARCLKEQAFETALEILGTVMRPNTSPPTVVPTVEGGIQLEWHQNDIDLEVEVKPEGQVLMFRQGGSQPEVSDVDISLEFRGLVDTIDNLEAVSP